MNKNRPIVLYNRFQRFFRRIQQQYGTMHNVIKRLNSRQLAGLICIICVMAVIFIADTLTDYEIAVPVFYVAIIITVLRHVSRATTITLAFICTALIVVSYYLTPSGSHHAGFLNAAIAIAIIGITTYLGLKLVAAETAAHEARAQLLRVTRVTSMGELTTSIAHEVNQPLAAIVTSANAAIRWIDQTPSNTDKAKRAIERVINDANRAGDIITRVRHMSKGEASLKRPMDLNRAVEDIVSLSKTELTNNHVFVSLSLADHLPLIHGDTVQIQQVIGNLVLNAIEAMAATEEDLRRIDIVTNLDTATNEVRLDIADTGVGLSNHADLLFESFWTTKPNGIGLGLSISRSIIEDHAGTIRATVNVPAGAVLHIRLPAIKH